MSLSGASSNTITNSQISGNNSTYGALWISSTSTNNTIANSTINGLGATRAVTLQNGNNTGNLLINNTILNATTLLYLDVNASSNTFCLNNFSSIGNPTAYVNDTNGSNYYNCTYGGISQTQGNIYANVMNGSIIVKGTNNSSISEYYIGDCGAVPYSNTTSGGKFSCNFVGCGDYAPLTNATGVCSSCIYSGTGNWTIELTDNCNITSSVNCGANYLIYNGTGTVTYNNSTAQIVITAKGEKLTNITTPFYEKIITMLWKNYTG
jgi:hypothetical protein